MSSKSEIPTLTDIVRLGRKWDMRSRVYGRIRLTGEVGCTDEQIQLAEGISGDQERPRRRELVQLGMVLDSGKYRYTLSGRRARVWVAK